MIQHDSAFNVRLGCIAILKALNQMYDQTHKYKHDKITVCVEAVLTTNVQNHSV